MNTLISGIHHVTAIAAGTRENLEFYTGILGLRLVKKTINFDAPDVYHLYYGDEAGHPGSILTFFPYAGLRQGRHGKGMLTTTSFSVPANSVAYWTERFKRFQIAHKAPEERFGTELVLYFEDRDGLGLELVFNDTDQRTPYAQGTVPAAHAIRGFYNVELWEEGYERTAGLLTEQLDHKLIAEKGNRFRFAATDTPGNYIDVVCMPDTLKGLAGSGTVHHLAFATPDREHQEALLEKIQRRQLNPTPVLDRKYFTSVYFREPGGVLFEVATAGPGFAVDEAAAHLGEELMLPAWLESKRDTIAQALPEVSVNIEQFK
jgi:glyoxalase family protein